VAKARINPLKIGFTSKGSGWSIFAMEDPERFPPVEGADPHGKRTTFRPDHGGTATSPVSARQFAEAWANALRGAGHLVEVYAQ
jgi:hypothetical protein